MATQRSCELIKMSTLSSGRDTWMLNRGPSVTLGIEAKADTTGAGANEPRPQMLQKSSSSAAAVAAATVAAATVATSSSRGIIGAAAGGCGRGGWGGPSCALKSGGALVHWVLVVGCSGVATLVSVQSVVDG